MSAGRVQVAKPLPECSVCQAPMARDRHAAQLGVCTRCIPMSPEAFRAARIRVDAEHHEARRLAGLARQRVVRRKGRRRDPA